MVRFIPASCFHTGSARFKLRGLPVLMAMPSSTPAESRALNTVSHLFLTWVYGVKRLHYSRVTSAGQPGGYQQQYRFENKQHFIFCSGLTPDRHEIMRIIPRKRNMLMCSVDLAAGFSRKQSLLAPDSSRPFGVTMSSGVRAFCNSSHISAMDSL